jgi:hypothetical protein
MIRFNECRAIFSAPEGGIAGVQVKPVGSTISRDAPSLIAVETGVWLATPPSIR